MESKSNATFFCYFKNTECHKTNHASKLSCMSEVHTAIFQHSHHHIQ